MPINPRGKAFQVAVRRADALPGYQRIRKDRPTRESAEALEREINAAIDTYGKWPVEHGDRPREARKPTLLHGTLYEAAKLTVETHWAGTPYEKQVTPVVWLIVEFMEKRGRLHLDDITSEDIDAYVRHCFEVRGSSANTVNHHLSALSEVQKLALGRKPPLQAVPFPIKRVKVKRIEKWWLRPEDQRRAAEWLRGQAEYVFADYLETLAFQGLRVAEGLRLAERHITGLGGDTPRMKVPGTKTERSESTIPVFPQSRVILERSIERARQAGWSVLFPMTWRQANGLWQQVRAFLGVDDIRTATLQAVRRSFAHYANENGMPTKTLQKVLRHETIVTTDKYLQLVGGADAEEARKYFKDDAPEARPDGWIAEAIAGFKSTGATPAEVAQFVKELMK